MFQLERSHSGGAPDISDRVPFGVLCSIMPDLSLLNPATILQPKIAWILAHPVDMIGTSATTAQGENLMYFLITYTGLFACASIVTLAAGLWAELFTWALPKLATILQPKLSNISA